MPCPRPTLGSAHRRLRLTDVFLGSGPDVVAKSYAQTDRIVAANAYTKTIDQARAETASLARE